MPPSSQQRFLRIGKDQFYRQDTSGNLTVVTDPDTMKGLKGGTLGFNAIESTRGLKFAGPSPAQTSETPTTQGAQLEQGTDINSVMKEMFASVLTNFAGVKDKGELEIRRQELLRKQLLAAPFSEEGERVLTGAQKLSLLRRRGQEFEPELKALEQEIIAKKNLPIEQMQTLSAMVDLGEKIGLFEGKKLQDFKEKYPQIALADTMEEALGFLAAEYKTDKALEQRLKLAQIQSAEAAAAAKRATAGKGSQLAETQVVMLSDAGFLPGVLNGLETVINNNLGLFGPISGRVPFSEDRITIEDDLRRASQLIGRFMEGGVLRKEDEEKYRKMLPELTDLNSKVALDKLEGVRNMLGLKYNNYLTDFGANGYDVSGFKGINFGSKGGKKTIERGGATFEVNEDGSYTRIK